MTTMTNAHLKSILAAALLASSLLVATAAVASALNLDPTFGTNGVTTVPAQKRWDGTSAQRSVERPGGGYLVAGAAVGDGYWEHSWMVTAFDASGKLDRLFGSNGRVLLPKTFGSRYLRYSRADSIAVAPDGKILVGSTVDVATNDDFDSYLDEYGDPECNCTASRAAFAVVRLTAAGKIDRSFGSKGVRLIRDVVRTWDEGLDAKLAAVAVDRRGRTVVFGHSTDVRGKGGWDGKPYGLIYRLTKGGAIDRTFGRRGRVVESNSGASTGSVAANVGIDARGEIRTVSALSVSADNKDRWSPRWVIHRYSARGAVDSTYGVRGVRRITPGRVELAESVIAPDGSVTLGGSVLAARTDSSSDPPIALQSVLKRISPAGVLDTNFGSAGSTRLSPPSGSGEVWLEGMSVRADGGVDLTERHRPGAVADKYNEFDFRTGMRSLSKGGKLLEDSSGQTITSLPELGNEYEFRVSSIFRRGNSVTLVGDRYSGLTHHENRITLMRVQP